MGYLTYAVAWALNHNGFPANQLCGWLNDMTGVTFADPLRQPGQFSGNISIRSAAVGARIKQITEPDQVALYAIWNSNNEQVVIWGGLITGRSWNRSTQILTITAVQWESWFATREVTPTTANALNDATFTFTSTDQFDIIRQLFTIALSEQDCPVMAFDNPSGESGVVRTIAWPSSNFETYTNTFEDLAYQSGGFDWKIDYAFGSNSNNLPQILPVIHFYYPERQALGAYYLRLASTLMPDGTVQGNLLDYTYPEDATSRMSRMWDTASGSSSDQIIRNAVSTDYGLGNHVYREANESLPTTITDPNLIDQHCRLAIQQASHGVTTSTAVTTDTNPALDRYVVGDRTQLILSDAWLNVNLPAVRIIERDVSAVDAKSIIVTLSLDVTDNYGPLVEA
jgi:hypothetical protein